MTPVTIPTANGATIGATVWTVPQPRAAVLVHPATAVTQGFYEHFAHYLAGLGFHVLTYDYRGTGRSRNGSLRNETVTMSDWMLEDMPAVTRWAAAHWPGLPLLAVGHSVGGHALVLSGEGTGVQAGVLVAAHAGITRTIRGRGERLRVWCVMRLLAPLLCALYGYMPGKRIGLGEDLPRGVMLQWSRWTTLARYFYDDPAIDAARRAAAVRMPLLVLGFDDDPWANPRAIDKLMAGVTAAPVERRQLAARTHGLAGIGHMGFFRRKSAPVWLEVGHWLLARAGAGRGKEA